MKYEIKGGSLPVVELTLEAGEQINCENGAMSWMSPNMVMETKGGGLKKLFSKAVTGEAMFSNIYTAQGGAGLIAFASSFPGSIMAVEVHPGQDIICQKGAYLASTSGVEVSVFFQKKFSAGFFGGEGFIMQKFSGEGLVFIEIDGAAEKKHLEAGQQIIIDTGYLAMMTGTCSMEIRSTGSAKNAILGGEGLFNTVITGPGDITLQTIPLVKMANEIRRYIPTSSN